MQFTPPADRPWSDEDIERLETFLFAEDNGLDGPLSASAIDGFFCALISGPNMIMPTLALKWVWDPDEGVQAPVFESEDQMQAMVGLLMQQWNAVASALMIPGEYAPLLLERTLSDGQVVTIMDDWCHGYVLGMARDMPAWTPLLTAQPEWFATMLSYGTEEGWAYLEQHPLSDEAHEAAADALAGRAQAIHAHFLAQRMPSASAAPRRREGPKVGRNDPCPCGSGRKYKQCHGAQ